MKLEYGVYPDFYKPKQFIVQENIKDPDLFVGRKIALTCFWDLLCDLTKGMNDNQAIIAQRKMGKTAFLRRFFNLAFVEQNEIIPMYFCFENKNLSIYEVAEKMSVTFLKQWLAFTTREYSFLECKKIIHLKSEIKDKIKDEITLKRLERDIQNCEEGLSSEDHMTVLSAAFAIIPHLSRSFHRRVMVIVDEMQQLELGNYFDKNGTSVKYADAIFEILDKPNIWTLASGSSVSMLHYEIVIGGIGNCMSKMYFKYRPKKFKLFSLYCNCIQI